MGSRPFHPSILRTCPMVMCLARGDISAIEMPLFRDLFVCVGWTISFNPRCFALRRVAGMRVFCVECNWERIWNIFSVTLPCAWSKFCLLLTQQAAQTHHCVEVCIVKSPNERVKMLGEIVSAGIEGMRTPAFEATKFLCESCAETTDETGLNCAIQACALASRPAENRLLSQIVTLAEQTCCTGTGGCQECSGSSFRAGGGGGEGWVGGSGQQATTTGESACGTLHLFFGISRRGMSIVERAPRFIVSQAKRTQRCLAHGNCNSCTSSNVS